MALGEAAAGGLERPTTLLARAVGRSGGSLTGPDQKAVRVLPDACAQAVAAAITLAISSKEPRMIRARIESCVAGGLRFAEGDKTKIVPPSAQGSETWGR